MNNVYPTLSVEFKRRSRIALIAGCWIAFFPLAAVLSALENLEEGQRAFVKGDYAVALKEFLPLARQGNPDAQVKLGFKLW